MKKTIITILATALVCCCVIGTTLAWLTDKTEPITNTFTVGNVDIELTESANLNLKMVPGSTIAKDPTVTVKAGSEACYVFVKIEASTTLDTYITYTVAEGWTALGSESGVYYRECAATADDVSYAVLANNQVTVKDSVTKKQMDALSATDAVAPTLTFTAYAVQSENVADAAAAWKIANPTSATTDATN